jgi:hypothetical protein
LKRKLSYDNAKLAHALILSGRRNGHQKVFDRGLKALRWLVGLQTSENGHFRPIGSNGFYQRGGTRSVFDQQPIEAQAMVSACLEAYRATSDPWWYEQAHRAFDWFLGWNDLGLELHSVNTGGLQRRFARGSSQRKPGRRINTGLPTLACGNETYARHGHGVQ